MKREARGDLCSLSELSMQYLAADIHSDNHRAVALFSFGSLDNSCFKENVELESLENDELLSDAYCQHKNRLLNTWYSKSLCI